MPTSAESHFRFLRQNKYALVYAHFFLSIYKNLHNIASLPLSSWSGRSALEMNLMGQGQQQATVTVRANLPRHLPNILKYSSIS